MHRYHHLEGMARQVMLEQGTEPPGSGDDHDEAGVFLCRQCDAPLYLSSHHFHSGCGWPSFDEEIPDAVERRPDGDRTEIICMRCHGHLGHVFEGENLTSKNVRHCVNAVSMRFVPAVQDSLECAYFGGGCFWGVQKAMKAFTETTEVGYMGGWAVDPTYDEVCSGNTGHTEVVKACFDPGAFEQVLRDFLEIDEPTSDKHQYRKVIFYLTEDQKVIADQLGIEAEPASLFYRAEDYHQNYCS